jgi:hypothetical protein
MKSTKGKVKIAAFLVLFVSLAFLIIGAILTHKIYDTDTDDFGILTFRRISERQIVIDATFHGVDRREGKLFTTYDRSKPRGKLACPT